MSTHWKRCVETTLARPKPPPAAPHITPTKLQPPAPGACDSPLGSTKLIGLFDT